VDFSPNFKKKGSEPFFQRSLQVLHTRKKGSDPFFSSQVLMTTNKGVDE